MTHAGMISYGSLDKEKYLVPLKLRGSSQLIRYLSLPLEKISILTINQNHPLLSKVNQNLVTLLSEWTIVEVDIFPVSSEKIQFKTY